MYIKMIILTLAAFILFLNCTSIPKSEQIKSSIVFGYFEVDDVLLKPMSVLHDKETEYFKLSLRNYGNESSLAETEVVKTKYGLLKLQDISENLISYVFKKDFHTVNGAYISGIYVEFEDSNGPLITSKEKYSIDTQKRVVSEYLWEMGTKNNLTIKGNYYKQYHLLFDKNYKVDSFTLAFPNSVILMMYNIPYGELRILGWTVPVKIGTDIYSDIYINYHFTFAEPIEIELTKPCVCYVGSYHITNPIPKIKDGKIDFANQEAMQCERIETKTAEELLQSFIHYADTKFFVGRYNIEFIKRALGNETIIRY